MLIYDVPLFQFAVPVAAVIVCVFLVFAFGFKSPGTPPTLDIHDDEEKLQKPKKSGGKKLGKSTDTNAIISTKQQFVAPKPLNNTHNNAKVAAATTSVEKPNEQPKLKTKKPTPKKVDENANISVAAVEEVGDWTTAVSKKTRKNQNKKKDCLVEPLVDSKLGEEGIVKEIKEQIIEKVEVEKAEDVIPSVKSVDDVVEEATGEELTQVTKQKKQKKNKKVDKVEDNVAVLDATIVEEAREKPVDVAMPSVADQKEVEKAVEAAEVVDVAVEEEEKMEAVKSKKKKKKKNKLETRTNFQEDLLSTSGVEVEDKSQHPALNSKSLGLTSEDVKVEKAQKSHREVLSVTLPDEGSTPVVSEEVESVANEQPRSPSDDQGEWMKAKPVKRKRQVQREH